MLTLFITCFGGKFLTKVEELVTQAVAPIIDERGDELVEVEYVKEKSQLYLRIFVDRRPDGIDMDEIAALSELVSEKLDTLEPDPFPDPYILELSSPGLERPIKTDQDLTRACGQYIHVGLYQKQDGQKNFEGTLLSFDDKQLTLQVKVKTRQIELTIDRQNIANIRFAIEF